MNLVFLTGIFVMVWWVVIFAVLPFGVKVPKEPGKGHATSAPANPMIGKKMVITTIIAAFITAIIYFMLKYIDFISLLRA